MFNAGSKSLGARLLTVSALLAGLGAGSMPGGAQASNMPYAGQTITVIIHYPSPPQSLLAQFTKDTGIKVKSDPARL